MARDDLNGMPEFVNMALGTVAMRRAFDDAGLPVDTQRHENFYIPEVALFKFLGSTARQCGDEALGALLGMHIDISNMGTWGRYALEGRTLRACLKRYSRASDALFPYGRIKVGVINDLVWIKHIYASRAHRDYVQTVLVSVGSAINTIRHYADR